MHKQEIIAEIGQNHNGDIELAKELIKLAKDSGADVAKFQVYEARSLFDSSSKNKWFDYNCKTELSKDEVSILAEYCEKINIEFMASVFDCERISWLEQVNVRRYKIASRSINDLELINELIKTKKPLIASLGYWRNNELPKIYSENTVDYLFCISKYPAPLEEFKLNSLNFKSKYSGFSDHSLGISAACSSFVLGSNILEKHFTIDKNMYGPDHSCSMNPDELKQIKNFLNDWNICK